MRKYRLKHPINIDGNKLRSLTCRRPVFGDTMKLLAADDLIAGFLTLAFDLADLSLENAAQLDMDDINGLLVHLKSEMDRLGLNAATTIPE